MDLEKKQVTTTKRIVGLDGLRGLSILLVILYHFFPRVVKGGYLGVPLLFILSGYLLSSLDTKKWNKNQYSIKTFYQSRVKRIYPPLFLFIGFISLFCYLFLPRLLNGRTPEVLSAFLGYNNFWQIAQNASYFDRVTSASPFTHLWSLAIELQFYLVWPWVFVIYQKAKARGNDYRVLFLMLTVISMLCMAFGYYKGVDISILYYHTATRISAILLGVWLGLVRSNKITRFIEQFSVNTLYSTIGAILAVTILAVFLMDGQSPSTYYIGLSMMTFLFGILLILAIQNHLPFGRLLDNPVLTYIGSRGYELYLWHYAVMFISNSLKIRPSFISLTIQFLIFILLAEFSYRLMNNKFNFVSQWFNDETTFQQYVKMARNVLYGVSGLGLGLLLVASSKADDSKSKLEADLAANSELLAKQREKAKENQLAETTIDMTNETETTVAPTVESDAESESEQETTTVNQDSADVAQQPITLIGDSVLLGSVKEVQAAFPNAYIEAEESRQAYEVADLFRQMIANGTMANRVVIALGTNGYFDISYGQELMDLLGPDREVYWITVYGEFLQWEASTNQVIYELASQYPNLKIVDWESQVKNHREWIIDDGIHPDIGGRDQYARILKETIEANQP